MWRCEWVLAKQMPMEQNLNDACPRSSPRFGSDGIDLQAPTSARAPQLYLSSTSSLSPSASAIHALTHSHLKIDIQDLGDRIMLTNVFISLFESVIMGC